MQRLKLLVNRSFASTSTSTSTIPTITTTNNTFRHPNRPMRSTLLLSSILTVHSFTTTSYPPNHHHHLFAANTFAFATPTTTPPSSRHLSKSSHLKMSTTTTTPTPPTEAPYGTWTSPITSKAITSGSVGISSLRLLPPSEPNTPPTLLWLESRSQEAGRITLCRYDPSSTHPSKSERNAVDVTPSTSNVRTRVHEYGGAAMTVGGEGVGDTVFYSEFATQRIMKLDNAATTTAATDDESSSTTPPEPIPITPEGDRYRFADAIYDNTNTPRLLLVREDHINPAPKDVVNEIAAVAVDGTESMTTLATGNDFYAAPRVSPDGTKLAYITWNHPNMPWDSTELRIVELDGDGGSAKTEDHRLVAGADGDTSVLQPLWHPLTGKLFYISDESGYYNIYREGTTESILSMEKDFGGSSPGWVFGQQGFSFLPGAEDGRMVTVYNKDGASRLVVANVIDDENGPATDVREYGMEDGLPMMFGGVVGSDGSDDLYFLGGSPSAPGGVFKWSLPSGTSTTTTTCQPAIKIASSSTLSFPPAVISTPQEIKFPTTGGKDAYAYYYPPHNTDYTTSADSPPPPLLVKAHGGPTSATGPGFNPLLQYWTSRGFAILDVNYGGSTGYGRDYRRRLRGTWGIVDVDDVCAGAQYLVEQGLADANRLCIDGGSAGGFTTLAALAFREVFTAGCSMYGVADLTALAGDTHKFESRYLDGLVGLYPKDEAIYKERSPIESIDTLDCPILLLQGDEDKIVPPNQSEMMHGALLEKGIMTCLKMYEGEQHGFRKAENIQDALDSELSFFRQVFGIDLGDSEFELKIDNMKPK